MDLKNPENNRNANESTEWSTLQTFEVDLFSLQIYGFLVCRGSVETKAEFLFDFITSGTKKTVPMISWGNPKFLKAMKLLITFSEVLPKKYLLLNKETDETTDNSKIDWD
jgi:hypothetical protein